MGIDLIIMPLKNERGLEDSLIFTFDRITFDRDYKIFGQIADLDGEPVVPWENVEITVHEHPLPPNAKVETYEEWGMGRNRKNHYNNERTYIPAGEMRKLKLPEDASLKNKAIMSYIKKLPKETPIIIDWR